MYQFFVENTQITTDAVMITGSDVNHIRNVLRMKPGEMIRVSNQCGEDFFCQISKITEDLVFADIMEQAAESTELPSRIYLFQGLPKSDKMELIIQKAVELGVYQVIPVAMKNCVVKLDEKKAEGKVHRWQEIAKSAAKQSKRSYIPEISMPVTYQKALEQMAQIPIKLLPYENERGMAATRETISAITPGAAVAVMIGPEGGFTPEEINLAVEHQMELISLGKRILRTETAGLATLAILGYQLESCS